MLDACVKPCSEINTEILFIYHKSPIMTLFPLQHLSSADLHPCLADLEVSLPAFAAHRIRKLQTPKSLIEEIENHPPPSPRPKPLQKPIKLDLSLCQSVLPQVSVIYINDIFLGEKTDSNNVRSKTCVLISYVFIVQVMAFWYKLD